MALFKQSQFAKEQIDHVQALLDDLELVDEWTEETALACIEHDVANSN